MTKTMAAHDSSCRVDLQHVSTKRWQKRQISQEMMALEMHGDGKSA